MHGGVDAEVVGHRGQDNVTVLKRLGDQLGDMSGGHIVHRHLAHALIAERRRQRLRRVLRVAVHRGVDDEHALGLRGIAAPCVVLFNEPAQILAPHGAVERADVLDLIQNAAGLFQQELDVGAVLAHDVGKVATGVVQPVPLEVHLVGEQLAVQRAEGAEGVGGKEDAVGDVEGHHGLRPVNHRRAHKGDGVLAEGEGVALLHLDALMSVHMEAELPHEHECLLVGDQFHLGMAQQDLLDAGGVIRLQMVDQQVVQLAAIQHIRQIFQKLAAGRPVHRVKEHRLFIQQAVGVVAYAPGNGKAVFKQGQAMVVGAHPVEVVRYFTHAIHLILPPSRPQAFTN